jgi:beta-phosphoglucomutase
MINDMRAAIFDLDGVIVDTAKYHYLAWKRLASELGFDFTEGDNERLKGVSRVRSLEILLEIGGLDRASSEREALAARKNGWYVEHISSMNPDELLPGAVDYIHYIRGKGVKTALASASKNAPLILDRLGIASLFDVVIDGTKVVAAKPDPEIFNRAAQGLGVPNSECVVFEDAEAGVDAARRAGMGSVGVGHPAILKDADMVIPGFRQLLTVNVTDSGRSRRAPSEPE